LADRPRFKLLLAKTPLASWLTRRGHANNALEGKPITGNAQECVTRLQFVPSCFPGELIKVASIETVFDDFQIGASLARAFFNRVLVYI
jgi:hypothetical protein